MKKIVSLILSFCVLFTVCGCKKPYDSGNIKRINGLSAEQFSVQAVDNESYISAYDKFSLDFFNTVNNADADKNVCLSPFSAYMAFSLCFAGSDGNTAEEFKNVFGLSKEQTTEFCQSLYANFIQREYVNKSTKVNLANSVWIDNVYSEYVKESYLKIATDYFNAPVFRCDFSDKATVNAVNCWCKDNTDGLIDKIIEEFDENQFMALINALLIETEWSKTYEKNDIIKSDFTNKDLTKKETEFLCRQISSYYSADDALAFKMYFKDGFSFIGILPNKGIPIDEYCNNLTAAKLSALLNNKQYDCFVNTRIPKFKIDYDIDLIGIMQAMGIHYAFNSSLADFKPMAEIPDLNVFIGTAIQKTHFELDENGVKAAAITYIGMKAESAMPEEKPQIDIFLDRPFVYILMDETANLPMFIGTIKTIN